MTDAPAFLQTMSPLARARYYDDLARHHKAKAAEADRLAYMALREAVEEGEGPLEDGTTYTITDARGYRMVPSKAKVAEAGLLERLRERQLRAMEVSISRKALAELYREDHPGATSDEAAEWVDTLCERESATPTPRLKRPPAESRWSE